MNCLTKNRFGTFSILLIGGCLLMATAGCTDEEALRSIDYEEGFVQFVNAEQSPRNVYTLRDEMRITVYEDYMLVESKTLKLTHIIPRERIIYAGQEIK